jgi:hypothetical protein
MMERQSFGIREMERLFTLYLGILKTCKLQQEIGLLLEIDSQSADGEGPRFLTPALDSKY